MNEKPRTQSHASPPVRQRTTDSPLALPSAGRALAALSSLVRLRCPNCRRGSVLHRWYGVHQRCSSCQFRYERSDENYFAGAVFVHFMLSGFGFAATLLVFLMVSWPTVPWDTLTYGAPLLILFFTVALYPISKVVWLTIDVMLRPVTPQECERPPL
jgi:uncharacterized protein (DUF983 family)